jgi:protein-tyrosine phosphatase
MDILFVCLGNICRSPLAEGIMADKAEKLGLNIRVASAGFERFHNGDPADRRSVEVARRHGIDLTRHTASMFSERDFDRFDRIYVMDRHNYRDVMSLARDSQDEKKVDYLLNLSEPGSDREVPDPWYGGMEGFENVFRMIDRACDQLAGEVQAGKKHAPRP